jgi:metal-responsive CopG/Arc/MetJ family transcriptional regulator
MILDRCAPLCYRSGMSPTETVSFTARMPRTLVDALDKLAKRELSSRNRELLIAVRSHIDADRKKGRA